MSGEATRLTFGAGAARRLDAVLGRHEAGRVLVVSTERALARAGLAHWPDRPGYRLFSGFRPNPDLEDVLAGCAVRDAWRPDLIVGLGGGSAMDVAKLVRALPAGRDAALEHLASAPDDLVSDVEALVLVPTTSGTGSEVTRFATVFDGERKLSFDHPLAAATESVVDPELTASCPAEVRTSCAMDALCHAVESLWARRSTPESRTYALRALRALAAPLAEGLTDTSPQAREVLSLAAIDAGRAINITRTTAAHAFAYRLTRRYGVPHGVACMLNLQWLYAYNRDLLGTHCGDDRGAAHVGEQLDAVAEVFGLSPDGVPARLGALLSGMNWSPRLADHGVAREDLPEYVAAGLGSSARAGNNPLRMPDAEVLRAVREIH